MFRSALVAATCLLIFSGDRIAAAELKFLHTTAIKPAVDELLAPFQAKTGDKVVTSYGPAGAIVQRVRAGEEFDLVIATSYQIADLEKENIVGAGTKQDLAKVGIGVYVKRGASKPDVSSVERFKQTLLNAKSVAYIDPSSGGASGIYISSLLQRLGLAQELRARTISPKMVADVFNSVASGDVEIGMGQLSEIVIDPRIELVGMLPPDIQNTTLFAIGVSSKSKEPNAAKALAAFMADSGSDQAFKKFGFERP
jgi:molybdate transport system substrate-binding protein